MNKQLKQVKAMFKRMKLIDVLFVVALLLILYHFLSNRTSNEQFVDYNPKPDEVNFVLFYAEWCPHCTRFEPVWDKLSTKLNGKQINGKTVNIKKVDCAKQGNNESCSDNGVSSYPTVKCFTKNGAEEYKGEREYDALKSFLEGVVGGL